MRRTLVVLVVTVLAGAAAASARGESLAPDVAAKVPMQVTIYCAVDEADWQAQVQRLHGSSGTRGMTERATGVVHLPSTTCAQLRAPFAVASALAYRALFHEFIHAALHTSVESQAECWSLLMYRYWLRRFFGASASDAQAAYVIGWADHMLLAPDYLGSCTFEKRDAVSPLNGF